MAVTLTGNIQLRTGILFFCLIYTLFDREGIMCSSCETVKQELNSFRSVHQLGHCFYNTITDFKVVFRCDICCCETGPTAR